MQADTPAAEAVAAAAISTELDLADALRLAVEMHQNRQLEGAETLYRRILAAAPQHADAMHFLGMVRHQLGNSDEGIALIEQAARLVPDFAGFHNNLGNIHVLCGKFATYVDNFKAQFSQTLYDRLKALNRRGMDCELIEYDSVINQMAMWCHLYSVDNGHPVYQQLLTQAQLEFAARAAQRSTRRRMVSPTGGPTQQRMIGRRMSVG